MNEKTLYPLFRLILVLLLVISFYFSIKYLLIYFYPFLLAILIATIINPLVTYLEKVSRINRGLITFIIIIVGFLFIFTILFYSMVEMIEGTAYLIDALPITLETIVLSVETFFQKNILPVYHKLMSLFQMLNPSQQLTIINSMKELVDELATISTNILKNILLRLSMILASLPYTITIVLFIALGTFLITKDWYKLKKLLLKYAPKIALKKGQLVLSYLKIALVGFIKAQLTLSIISACITFTSLLIFRIEHAFLITLIVLIIDLFPYLGIGLFFIPWILYSFIITGNYLLTIQLAVTYVVIIIFRQLIEPKILADNIGINPLTTLIVLFISIKFWGIIGFILTPLLLIVLSALFKANIFSSLWNFIVQGEDVR